MVETRNPAKSRLQTLTWKNVLQYTRGKECAKTPAFSSTCNVRAPWAKHRIRHHLRHLLRNSTPQCKRDIRLLPQTGWTRQVSRFIETEHTSKAKILEKCRQSPSCPISSQLHFASVALLCQTRCHKRCRLANVGLPQLSHHKAKRL